MKNGGVWWHPTVIQETETDKYWKASATWNVKSPLLFSSSNIKASETFSMFCALYNIMSLAPKEQDFNCILNLQAGSSATEKRCLQNGVIIPHVLHPPITLLEEESLWWAKNVVLQMCVFNMTNTSLNVLKSWAMAQEKRKINAETESKLLNVCLKSH